MHYYRIRRHGDPHTKLNGKGCLRNGYRVVFRPGHPVAEANGMAYEHRVILYGVLGPGSHPCRWCGLAVTWGKDLTVDHVDLDRLNNSEGNLVPAHHACNCRRVWAQFREAQKCQ